MVGGSLLLTLVPVLKVLAPHAEGTSELPVPESKNSCLSRVRPRAPCTLFDPSPRKELQREHIGTRVMRLESIKIYMHVLVILFTENRRYNSQPTPSRGRPTQAAPTIPEGST